MSWALDMQGVVPYPEGTRIQLALQQLRIDDRIPDTFLLLEHHSVITLGRRGRTNHLVASEALLKQRQTEVVTASRGGDVTWHGPGQLVCYPIVKVSNLSSGSHGFLERLEQVAIDTAARLGVSARRVTGKAGAWTDAGKLAAIGFSLKRWVSCHGLSFNLNPDLSHFDLIVGCGLVGDPVTSIAALRGSDCPDMATTRHAMLQVLGEQFDRPIACFSSPEHMPEILNRVLHEA